MSRLNLVSVFLLALVMLGGCEWSKRLPFEDNELDASLEGFWWRLLPDTSYCSALNSQEMLEFRRGKDTCWMTIWRGIGGDSPRVARFRVVEAFTKKGHLYYLKPDLVTSSILAEPYTLLGDTLTVSKSETAIGERFKHVARYLRVVDTSGVDWAFRRRKGSKLGSGVCGSSVREVMRAPRAAGELEAGLTAFLEREGGTGALRKKEM